MHRNELVKLIGVTALILVSACNPKTESNNTADTIFFGGSVVTMDATESIAEAIAIRDKQIIAVGVPGSQMSAYSQDYAGPLTSEQVRALAIYIRSWEEEAPDVPNWRDGQPGG